MFHNTLAVACKKTECWGAGMVICLGRSADLHMVRLMPLPLTVSSCSKIQIGVTFLVPAHSGSLSDKGLLNGCFVVVVVELRMFGDKGYIYFMI